jgi:hypothetical protein
MSMLMLALVATTVLQDPVDPPARRRLPTAEELANAFRDDATKAFVLRARAERQRVDSSLASYGARAYERITAGGTIGPVGGERTLASRESVGDVTWSQATGAFIEMKGQRRAINTAIPVPNPVGDLLVPVPWYPGMDALWLPSANGPTGRGGREAAVDTTNLVHPISEGSEAYYTFSLGDSVSISLADGRRISLRELRARPRAPRWNLTVGSYWFDSERAQLVRAIYRLSVPYDVWFEVDNALGKGEKGPPWYVRALAQPLKAELQAVTLEYGLYADRFWLPRMRRVDGTVQAGPAKMAISIEQGFVYNRVNAVPSVPAIPAANLALRAVADSINTDFQQLNRDRRGLRTKADSVVWTARRKAFDARLADYNTRAVQQRDRDCAATGVRYQTGTRLGNAVTTRVAVPCSVEQLANAPELSEGMLAERRAAYASTLDEATRSALGLGEQAAFAPQRVTRHVGLEYLRFNRVEALSVGGALRQQLGAGWSWEGNARGSFGDRTVNGELFATRTNGGQQLTLAGYRRLVQADDYGFAFGPFASLQNLLGAQDEQFYYRAAGAELVVARGGRGAGGLRTESRLFAEWQEGVGTQAEISVPWLLDRANGFARHVIDTLPYAAGRVLGAQWRLQGARGVEQRGWRVGTALRVEGAVGSWQYARAAADLTVNRALPGALRATWIASGGSSVGTLPLHRGWNLGGWQTLRGQRAGSLRGDAYWMARSELQWTGRRRVQPGVFFDAGWAGDRAAIGRGDGVLTSVGGGVGLLGLPVRLDAARPIARGGKWQVDLYAPIRF